MYKLTTTIMCFLVNYGSLFTPTVVADADVQPPVQGRATVEVRSDVGWIGPSQTFNIIVAITPEPDWHVYWKNPGVSGAATEIEVSAPEGFKVGEPVFPRPTIIQTTDGPTYGYGDLAAIFIPVTAPDLIKEEPVTFKILTMWLACKKTCVLGESETDLTLAMNSETSGPLHKDLRLSKWQKRLPKELNLLKEGSCRIVESDLMISGVVGDQAVTFIGVERQGVRFKGQISTTSTEGKFTLTVPLVLEYSPVIPEAIEVEGLLLFGSNPDDDSYVIRATAEP